MNKNVSGSWWNISKQSTISRDEVKMDVFKLWIDHGTRPSNETYQYIVVPATSLEKMEQNVSKKNIIVLANTYEVQAVNHRGLNISQVIFYQSGEVELPGGVRLASVTPGAIMIKTRGGKVSELSVADPSRMLGKMHLAISGKINLKGDGVTCVYDKKKNSTAISVALPQTVYAGSSFTVK
jgi:chondroitin AC lyase